MLRFSTCTAIVLTGAFVTMIWSLQPTNPLPDSLVGAAPSEEKVQELVTSYACFKHTLTATLRSLQNGEMRLEEARNRIHDCALHYFPDYLRHIETSEHATNDEDRIARNLIGHLRNIEGGGLILGWRVLALEVEYVELQRRHSTTVGPRI